MKANDIATHTKVPISDVEEVCKNLGIPFDLERDFSEQEFFLINKSIETAKNKKAEEARNKPKGKIKLKRKVNVPSKELQEAKPEALPDKKTAAKTAEEVEQSKNTDKQKPKQVKEQGEPKDKQKEQRDKRFDSQSLQRHDRSQKNDRSEKDERGERLKHGVQKNQGQRQGGRGGAVGGKQTGMDANSGGDFRQRRAAVSSGIDARRGSFAGRDGRRTSSSERAGVAQQTPIELEDLKKRNKSQNKEKDKEKEERGKYRKDRFEEKYLEQRKKPSLAQQQKNEAVTPGEISITESITVGELSKKLNIKAGDVISKLMKIGVMATINQSIDSDTAQILAAEYGTDVKVVSLYDETVIHQEEEDKPEDRIVRPPVVTVMGHVDHGKTKLLDAIRETKVAESEHGGITQHIGAYVANINGKSITFLDTPGHAAFTTMRSRGAQVTDIVILVVAANDGVMPQTVEAINHAKAADVPIIVAINKIDLEDANPDKVKNELAPYELIPEEWGGTTLFAEISAKKKINITELLELVLIQAEMLELKENPKLLAKGVVLESRLDAGRGAVSTILVKRGTLHVGDPFVVGHFSGKVRAMFDDQGKEIKAAGPSTPVEVLGISGVPAAGDPFECVDSERTAKQISQKRTEYQRIESAKKVRKVTLESLNDMIKEGEVKELCIIVKADVDGSAQALTESLEKLSTEEIRVNVIHSGTGGINESDVVLASASNAIIIGYHVRPTGKVSDMAEREHVSIRFFNIIFEATDAVKAAMEGMLSPDIKEEITGTGVVKQIFKISKIGTIAGAVLETGKLKRKSKMRIVRDGVVVFDGELKSLKHFKDDASEITAGQECGFGLKNFNDIKEGDGFEAYELIEIAKTL